MRDTQLGSQILGIAKSWKVTATYGAANWFATNAASGVPARTSASRLAPSGHRPAEAGSGSGCRGCSLNAVILGVDNSLAEGVNRRIKTVKIRAREFRNKQRFRNAIDVHLGGLQLYWGNQDLIQPP